jgi:hypothetical protein
MLAEDQSRAVGLVYYSGQIPTRSRRDQRPQVPVPESDGELAAAFEESSPRSS